MDIPSFAFLALLAGIVVFALAAFNWEDISIITPNDYNFQAGAGESPLIDTSIFHSGAEHHTLQYAATGIPGLSTLLQLPEILQPMGENILPSESSQNIIPEMEENNDLIAFEWRQHRVRRGEVVSRIAEQYGVSIGAVIASNDIRNARRLQEGAVLRIPNIDGIPHIVKNGDSLLKIAATYNVPLEVILDVNDIMSDVLRPGEAIFIPGARMNDMDLRASLGDLFKSPVSGRLEVTSRYGMRRDPFTGALSFHNGVDLRARTGTPILASMDGVISVTGENWLYGKFIIVTHPNGYKTLYAHLNALSVKQGDRVIQGRKIGEAGNTGRSTGSHLHFSVYDNKGKLIDPLDLIR